MIQICITATVTERKGLAALSGSPGARRARELVRRGGRPGSGLPQGAFQLKRQTRRDRMRAKLRAIKEELKRRMHEPIPLQR